MSAQWHYTRNGESVGPVTAEELRRLAGAGGLAPTDLVWKDGMGDWQPARNIKGLFAATAAAAARPVAAAAPQKTTPAAAVPASALPSPAPAAAEASQISYFSSTSGLTERTVKIMNGYASATGDRGSWPLDDQQLTEFKQAEAARKKIRNAASLYRGLFALCVIATVIVVIAGAFAASGPRGGGSMLIPLGITIALTGGMCVLYHFASGATRKCHRWAPLTLFILFLLTIALQLFSLSMLAMSSRGPGAEMVAPILGMILPAAFAASSWQAYVSIPKFLASPMWCQEALVHAGL